MSKDKLLSAVIVGGIIGAACVFIRYHNDDNKTKLTSQIKKNFKELNRQINERLKKDPMDQHVDRIIDSIRP